MFPPMVLGNRQLLSLGFFMTAMSCQTPMTLNLQSSACFSRNSLQHTRHSDNVYIWKSVTANYLIVICRYVAVKLAVHNSGNERSVRDVIDKKYQTT